MNGILDQISEICVKRPGFLTPDLLTKIVGLGKKEVLNILELIKNGKDLETVIKAIDKSKSRVCEIINNTGKSSGKTLASKNKKNSENRTAVKGKKKSLEKNPKKAIKSKIEWIDTVPEDELLLFFKKDITALLEMKDEADLIKDDDIDLGKIILGFKEIHLKYEKKFTLMMLNSFMYYLRKRIQLKAKKNEEHIEELLAFLDGHIGSLISISDGKACGDFLFGFKAFRSKNLRKESFNRITEKMISLDREFSCADIAKSIYGLKMMNDNQVNKDFFVSMATRLKEVKGDFSMQLIIMIFLGIRNMSHCSVPISLLETLGDGIASMKERLTSRDLDTILGGLRYFTFVPPRLQRAIIDKCKLGIEGLDSEKISRIRDIILRLKCGHRFCRAVYRLACDSKEAFHMTEDDFMRGDEEDMTPLIIEKQEEEEVTFTIDEIKETLTQINGNASLSELSYLIHALRHHSEHPERVEIFDTIAEKIRLTKDKFFSYDFQRIIYALTEMGEISFNFSDSLIEKWRKGGVKWEKDLNKKEMKQVINSLEIGEYERGELLFLLQGYPRVFSILK